MDDGPVGGTAEATALIVAAGSGQRLGAGGPKALVPVGGRPLYEWSLDACLAAGSIASVVIAVPPGRADDFDSRRATLVEGAEVRSQSVRNGLAKVDTPIVVVHDAARPLAPPEHFDAVVARLVAEPALDGVVVAAPVTDTTKRVDDRGRVLETVDRAALRAIQTPQAFRADALRRAMETGDLGAATDDASLIEAAGGEVEVLDSAAANLKVTVPGDIALAEFMMTTGGRSRDSLAN